MYKICTKCKESKDSSHFYRTDSRPNGNTYCKECFNKYCIQRWIDRKVQAISYKGGKCIDCNLSLCDSHYSVFEFHHLDPSQKDYSWVKLRLRTLDSIRQELDKCVLLCANCHRVRHALSS